MNHETLPPLRPEALRFVTAGADADRQAPHGPERGNSIAENTRAFWAMVTEAVKGIPNK